MNSIWSLVGQSVRIRRPLLVSPVDVIGRDYGVHLYSRKGIHGDVQFGFYVANIGVEVRDIIRMSAPSIS